MDSITITSKINGFSIDTCSTFVSNLIPNTLTSINILSTDGTSLTVNDQYTIRFNITLVDGVSQTDSFRITFPVNTVLDFQSSTISSNVLISQNNASYVSNVLTMYMNDIGRTFAPGNAVVFTVGTYTAPPSIKTTDAIKV